MRALGEVMSDPVRCPKCSKRDSIQMIETHDEWGVTDFGRIERDHNGALIPPSIFYFSPGDSTRVELKCGNCEHQWKPREQSVSLSPDTETGTPKTQVGSTGEPEL